MSDVRERSSGWLKFTAGPVPPGILLALIAMNLSAAIPDWGIDSSFRVALTQAVLDNLRFGIDVAWPYGPLGFLAGPTALHRGMLAVAILYQFVVLVVLFSLVVLALGRSGLHRRWMLAVLVPFALAISVTENIVPELVANTVLLSLILLRQDDQAGSQSPRNGWLLAITGVVAGSLILVKFGPGLFACAMVGWFALVSRARLMHVPLALAAIAAGFFCAWFGSGQEAASLLPYVHTSLDLSSGYQDAQASAPYGGRLALTGLMALAAVAILVFGAWRQSRHDRRTWLILFPLALMLWFTLKQGFVRWDTYHANGALIMLGLLAMSFRWEKRFLLLPAGVMLMGTLMGLANEPARMKTTWPKRAEAVLAALSSGRQARALEAARATLRESYAVPEQVVAALRDGSVHAESWDINALWANNLQWNPLPNLQSYSTYTTGLDRINAARYESAPGPDRVLLNPDSTDNRYALWESPDARVALTCNFVPVAAGGTWTALRRAPSACGAARPLQSVTAEAGQTIPVPEPRSAESLVVARFTLPSDPIAKLLTSIAKPPRYAGVTIDGTAYRLVIGTAGSAHLLRSPGATGERQLPHGRVQHSTLSFSNVGSGLITVQFEEIPLAAQ